MTNRTHVDELEARAVTGETPLRRIAGAPISWGVCEVPGWGAMLPPDRVFAEMAGLGLVATELGPLDDWLPLDAGAIRAALEPHGLGLVGGFVPLVLHGRSADDALAQARRVAGCMAAAGADTFVLAIVEDLGWSAPKPLDDAGWTRLGAHVDAVAEATEALGMRTVIHPHAGTLVERAEDVERLLDRCSAGWCLDPGHLLIGGYDPLAFARSHGDRVAHVHLKDVDGAVATRLTAGELTLMGAVQAGLFRPLGQGDAGIGAVVGELARQGYDGWAVLEQDTAITGTPPAPGTGPVADVATSLRFLGELAPAHAEAAR
ncbi:sugar phosphate isomerase/epimerase family protein [Conexibacter arvalis]|uniref:Inosose dehydratase n=1 Tax=Conexibacter arvalis TaxID=912552 RepID=A0A840I886_9ACTN|nr:sugar phosphate isomerase/epimerase [Conexibacter arvalis]MBB4660463.1 inosose dehydratase [Conexibacter arvalis]